MNEHEKRLRDLLGKVGKYATAWTQEMREAASLLSAALAQARADALEEAAQAAFSTSCEFCKEPCEWDPTGGEARDGAWHHVEVNERTSFHSARPLGTIGAVERIRALSATPPATIPVERVRGVLIAEEKASGSEGARLHIASIARALDVPLDGAASPPLVFGSRSALMACEHGYAACPECDCDATNLDEGPLCGGCDGSGEGQHEGTRCRECNGRGREMSP